MEPVASRGRDVTSALGLQKTAESASPASTRISVVCFRVMDEIKRRFVDSLLFTDVLNTWRLSLKRGRKVKKLTNKMIPGAVLCLSAVASSIDCSLPLLNGCLSVTSLPVAMVTAVIRSFHISQPAKQASACKCVVVFVSATDKWLKKTKSHKFTVILYFTETEAIKTETLFARHAWKYVCMFLNSWSSSWSYPALFKRQSCFKLFKVYSK